MQYIKQRLKQASTWAGLSSAIAIMIASGGVINTEVISILLTAFGLVHINT